MIEQRATSGGAGNSFHTTPLAQSRLAITRAMSYRGPERRGGAALMARLTAGALDEVDYGLVLLADDHEVLHLNHAARAELATVYPLQLDGRRLTARLLHDQQALQDALLAASRRGLRRLLTLGEGSHKTGISVVPLGRIGEDPGFNVSLLVLGKHQVCGPLSVQGFARTHRLSPGEEQVLCGLCEGTSPLLIAARHRVAISTIRTQIANIRQKTGAVSIRDLIHQVAVLPPLVSVLRQGCEPGR